MLWTCCGFCHMPMKMGRTGTGNTSQTIDGVLFVTMLVVGCYDEQGGLYRLRQPYPKQRLKPFPARLKEIGTC